MSLSVLEKLICIDIIPFQTRSVACIVFSNKFLYKLKFSLINSFLKICTSTCGFIKNLVFLNNLLINLQYSHLQYRNTNHLIFLMAHLKSLL